MDTQRGSRSYAENHIYTVGLEVWESNAHWMDGQMHSQDNIEHQIKELERDKRIEEIKQLRTKGKRSWITPTVITALLPLLGAFFLWVYGEAKQFNEGFKALQERDQLKTEKHELEQQKANLNIEISTLRDLKNHYEDEAGRLRREQGNLRKENVTLSADRKKLRQQRDEILQQQKLLGAEYEKLTILLKDLVDTPGLPISLRVKLVQKIRLGNLGIDTVKRIALKDTSQV